MNDEGLVLPAVIITIIIFFLCWMGTDIVHEDANGNYYIKTHGCSFILASKDPVVIGQVALSDGRQIQVKQVE